MKLEEVAIALGYDDVDHLERNIELYGEPLIKWWSVIQQLVNKNCNSSDVNVELPDLCSHCFRRNIHNDKVCKCGKPFKGN